MPGLKQIRYKDLVDDETVTILVESDSFKALSELMVSAIKAQYSLNAVPEIVDSDDAFTVFVLRSAVLNDEVNE